MAIVVRDEGADHSEDRPRGTHAHRARDVREGVGGGAREDAGGEEDHEEPDPPELLLDHGAEDPQCVGVQQQMEDATVQEDRRQHAPLLSDGDADQAVRERREPDRGAHTHEVDGAGPLSTEPAPPTITSSRYPMPMSTSNTVVTDVAFAFATATRRPGPWRYSRRASATHVGH